MEADLGFLYESLNVTGTTLHLRAWLTIPVLLWKKKRMSVLERCANQFETGFTSQALVALQAMRNCASDARASPRLMSGTIVNSSAVTPLRSTVKSSDSVVTDGGLKLYC